MPLTQMKLGFHDVQDPQETGKPEPSNGRANKLDPRDRAFHDWYRFVLSFPPHWVRDYIKKFQLNEKSVLLDPFCGTGTTLVEAKLAGMRAIGLEGNPFPYFASSVKTDWALDADLLTAQTRQIANQVREVVRSQAIDDDFQSKDLKSLELKTFETGTEKLILANSISPLPLHKTLSLIEHTRPFESSAFYRHALLVLGNALVFKISNLHFGPEVGVKIPKVDIPVLSNWLSEIEKMANDLRGVQGKEFPAINVHLADARSIEALEPNSIDAVITSPPIPMKKTIREPRGSSRFCWDLLRTKKN